MNTIREYTEAIRTRVCTECLLPAGTGLCGTGSPEECPLNKFLPRAVDAVNRGKSKSIIDYFKSLQSGHPGLENDEMLLTNEEASWFREFLPFIEIAVEETKAKEKKTLRRFQ